jgi:signal transduction histidine kinase
MACFEKLKMVCFNRFKELIGKARYLLNISEMNLLGEEKKRPGVRLEYILLMAFLVFMLLAGMGLYFLKTTHERQTRVSATEYVLNRGVLLLNTVCAMQGVSSTNAPLESLKALSDTADTIFSVRPDVQSLSIMRDGVTVFHRQSQGLETLQATNGLSMAGSESDTVMSGSTLEIGGVQQPVFVFSRAVGSSDGRATVIEATLKRGAVGQAEETARKAVSSLFLLSMVVLLLSFSACAGVLVLAILRDRRREARSRQEEHLAFSGVLANGILHDFRNPMSAVRLDAQMLEREMVREGGFRSERVTELSGRIARTMARMDKIFHEFLFLAKPADEKPEVVHIAQVMKECVDTLSPRIEQAEVQVTVKSSENLPGAEAFPFALRRAFLNVLVNALQFAPKGSLVEVVVTQKEAHLVTDILDRGPGIPPQQRKKIFDLFVTTRPEGTGLGLFLARTAIQRCNGTIEALPREGGGTCIRITLPVLAEKSS